MSSQTGCVVGMHTCTFKLCKSQIALQMGDSNGSKPKFAVVNASAMVAKGAERALPIVVRRSRETPKVDNQRIKVRT